MYNIQIEISGKRISFNLNREKPLHEKLLQKIHKICKNPPEKYQLEGYSKIKIKAAIEYSLSQAFGCSRDEVYGHLLARAQEISADRFKHWAIQRNPSIGPAGTAILVLIDYFKLKE